MDNQGNDDKPNLMDLAWERITIKKEETDQVQEPEKSDPTHSHDVEEDDDLVIIKEIPAEVQVLAMINNRELRLRNVIDIEEEEENENQLKIERTPQNNDMTSNRSIENEVHKIKFPKNQIIVQFCKFLFF
jgi:hypothetical protein